MPCGDGHSSDEKSPVNQRGAPICGKNGCVFQFPQKTHAETDYPRVRFSELLIYHFGKRQSVGRIHMNLSIY